MQRRHFHRWAAATGLGLVAGGAAAQSDRPISLVVGYSAGGSADLTARVVGAELAKKLGRPVAVENVTGASGMRLAAYGAAVASHEVSAWRVGRSLQGTPSIR